MEDEPRIDLGRLEAIMVALMQMEDRLEQILRILFEEDDGEEDLEPEEREKVIALIREVKQEVQELREYVESFRHAKR